MSIKRSASVWQSIDWISFALYLAIVLFGWLTVYAVQYSEGSTALFDFGGIHGRQMMWIGVSLVAGSVILIFDAEFFPSFSWPIYGAVLLMLVAVMFFGREVNGARSWLEFGTVKIQPAEFAKYATALALAKYLSMPGVNMAERHHRIRALSVLAAPMGLIVLQGDVGSALVFASFLVVLYREGFSIVMPAIGAYIGALFVLSLVVPPGWLYGVLALVAFGIAYGALQRPLRKQRTPTIYLLLILFFGLGLLVLLAVLTGSFWASLIGTAVLFGVLFFAGGYLRRDRQWVLLPVAAFAASLFFGYFGVDFALNSVLESHQKERILTMLGQAGDSYNVDQSKMTIASGGWTGKGFLQGTFTRYGHVPEQKTDFIFCTIGEELGFVGTIGFLAAYLALLMRIVAIAERQRSSFSRDFAYGVAGIFFVQIAINVGMTIGLVPVIGIPLPFISYGGSSVLAFSLLVFTMLRLDADRLLVLR